MCGINGTMLPHTITGLSRCSPHTHRSVPGLHVRQHAVSECANDARRVSRHIVKFTVQFAVARACPASSPGNKLHGKESTDPATCVNVGHTVVQPWRTPPATMHSPAGATLSHRATGSASHSSLQGCWQCCLPPSCCPVPSPAGRCLADLLGPCLSRPATACLVWSLLTPVGPHHASDVYGAQTADSIL